MGQGLAHYEVKEQVAIVTIDHPPMNALDTATKEDIGEVFLELDDRREEIRAVILRGAGEKAFAAGADIKTFPGTTTGYSQKTSFTQPPDLFNCRKLPVAGHSSHTWLLPGRWSGAGPVL